MYSAKTEKITLFIACTGLPDKDTFSKSDPYVDVIYDQATIGATEYIKNDLNPQFRTTVTFVFDIEEKIKFVVYDYDPVNSDVLGEGEAKVSDILALKGNELILDLEKGGR